MQPIDEQVLTGAYSTHTYTCSPLRQYVYSIYIGVVLDTAVHVFLVRRVHARRSGLRTVAAVANKN
jgi:hypothetical protein